jgi:hypothetical protein
MKEVTAMLKTILMIFLVVIASSSAFAEWREVGTDAAQQVTTYADPSTIRQTGDKARMWHLFDFKTANAVGSKTFRSLKGHSEYDCRQKQSRILSTSAHEGNMGTGAVVRLESTSGDWRPIPLDTPKEFLLRIACGR